MYRQALVVSLFAWVLWMDQTVYAIPGGPDDRGPGQLESATGRRTQLSTTNTKEECEALRQARMQTAKTAEDAQDASAGRRPRYREQFRYFCSPTVDQKGK